MSIVCTVPLRLLSFIPLASVPRLSFDFFFYTISYYLIRLVTIGGWLWADKQVGVGEARSNREKRAWHGTASVLFVLLDVKLGGGNFDL